MAEGIASRGQSSEATSSQRDIIRVRDVGLTKLFEPQDGVAIADVFFVHGLQGHPWKTWRVKEVKSSDLFSFKKRPSTRVFWPHDLLPDDAPNVRLFTYGYDSHVSHYVSGPANQSNISQHGLTLLNAVSGKRHECQNRPVIFVAHSLGGLLVKQALIESSKQDRDGRDRNLHKACRAVIFFGTPHRGSPDASLGSIIAGIAKGMQFDINKSILRDLDPKSGSPTLGNILDDFNSLLTQQKIQVYTFQESAGKTGFGPFSGKVVPEESSSFGFRKFEQRDMINKNHMEMCRFWSRDDDGYEKFLDALRGYLKEIATEKERIEEENKEERHQDLLRIIDFAERSAREQQIGNTDADSSTFEWIWNVQNSDESFSQWLTDNQPVFWVQGKPGSGKSVLMDYLSKTDQFSQRLDDAFGPQWIRIWFFFDFRADHSIANSFEGLLRSLLLQVLEVVPGMEPELRQFRNKTHVFGNVPEWNKRNLQEAFYKALANVPSRLYIFADGLDEYSGNMQELLAFFQGLSGQRGIEGGFKICLASRPESLIELVLRAYPGFRMQDRNFKGIEQYVSVTVTGLGFAAKDEHRLKQLCADIAESADGVFLWARFAVSEVIGSYAKGDTTSELKRRLGEIPSDMEGIYARIFRRMGTNDRDEARLAFQLVCFAITDRYRKDGGLTILQLKEAIAVAKKCTADSIHDCGVDSLEIFRKRIRAKCGGLLEEIPITTKKSDDTDPKGWTITLIHRTVASYLEREGWLSGWQIGNEYFQSPDALWLHICCKCVQTTWGSSALLASRRQYKGHSRSSSKSILKPFNRHSLVEYASSNLFHHATSIEQQSKNQASSYPYLSIVTPETWSYLRGNYRTWDFLRIEGFPQTDWEAVDKDSDNQPWQIVVEQGLALCCGDLVKNNLYKPLGHGQDISLAIRKHAAFFERADPQAADLLIRLLINSGSIVSQRNILECLYIGTASTLELLLDTWPKAAIQLNRKNMILVRRKGRADTYDDEAVGPLWELARCHQSWGEFEPMLDLLLERGERFDQSCGPGGTMLHAFIIRIVIDNQPNNYIESQLNQIKTLLEREVNVNAPGPRGTPLQYAWRLFHSPKNLADVRNSLKDVMTLLMDYGADTDWTEPNGAIVNEATIRAWCALSYKQIKSQSKLDYAFCTAGWYTYEYPLYFNEIGAC